MKSGPQTMATEGPSGRVMMSRDEQTVRPTQTAPTSYEPRRMTPRVGVRMGDGFAGGRTMGVGGRAPHRRSRDVRDLVRAHTE